MDFLKNHAVVIGAIAALIAIIPFLFKLPSKCRQLLRKWNAGQHSDAQRMVTAADTVQPKIIGRDGIAEDIRTAFETCPTVVIHGGMGAGKTTIARHYRNKFQLKYPLSLTFRAQTDQDLIADLAQFAVDHGDGKSDEKPQDLAAKALVRIKQQAGTAPVLIVLDNVEQPDRAAPTLAIARWMPQGAQLHTLITARNETLAQSVTNLPAPSLTEADCIAILENLTQDTDPAFAEIARELDRLPIAVVQAGRWMAESNAHTAAAFLAEYHDILLEDPGDDPAMFTVDRKIAAVVRMAWRSLPPEVQELGSILAVLSPDHDAKPIFELMRDLPPDEDNHERVKPISPAIWALIRSDDGLDDAYRALRRAGLIERVEDGMGMRMHRAIQIVIRAQSEHTACRHMAVSVLASVFPHDAGDSQNWPVCRLITPHMLPFLHGDPVETEAMEYLANQASIYFQRVAEYDVALILAQLSFDLKITRLPAGHRNVGVAHSRLGSVYGQLNRSQDAVAAYRHALHLGQVHDHPARDIATSASNLGLALQKRWRATGQPDLLVEALTHLRTSLASLREIFGGDSAEVTSILNNLGAVRRAQGRVRSAIVLYQAAVRIGEVAHVPSNIHANRLNNLGAVLLQSGWFTEAQPHLQHAYDILSVELPPKHPDLIITGRWLVSNHLALARAGVDAEQHRTTARDLCDTYDFDWGAQEKIAGKLPLTPLWPNCGTATSERSD